MVVLVARDTGGDPEAGHQRNVLKRHLDLGSLHNSEYQEGIYYQFLLSQSVNISFCTISIEAKAKWHFIQTCKSK